MWIPSKFAKFTLRLYLSNLPHPSNLPQTPTTNAISPPTYPIDISSPHTPLCSLKTVQNAAPIPAPELAKHHRTTGSRSAYWNRGCCYAKERTGCACNLQPNSGEYWEAMGGDATPGTGWSVDGAAWSYEDQLVRVDPAGEESWYVSPSPSLSLTSKRLLRMNTLWNGEEGGLVLNWEFELRKWG